MKIKQILLGHAHVLDLCRKRHTDINSFQPACTITREFEEERVKSIIRPCHYSVSRDCVYKCKALQGRIEKIPACLLTTKLL